MIQNTERHNGTALAMSNPVHQVADIVQKAGDFCQFHSSFRITQGFQQFSGGFCHLANMCKAMLRVPQGIQ